MPRSFYWDRFWIDVRGDVDDGVADDGAAGDGDGDDGDGHEGSSGNGNWTWLGSVSKVSTIMAEKAFLESCMLNLIVPESPTMKQSIPTMTESPLMEKAIPKDSTMEKIVRGSFTMEEFTTESLCRRVPRWRKPC